MKFNRAWPKQGAQRVVTKFLLFQKTIDGETRWLEKASWVEKAYRDEASYFWKPIRWTTATKIEPAID